MFIPMTGVKNEGCGCDGLLVFAFVFLLSGMVPMMTVVFVALVLRLEPSFVQAIVVAVHGGPFGGSGDQASLTVKSDQEEEDECFDCIFHDGDSIRVIVHFRSDFRNRILWGTSLYMRILCQAEHGNRFGGNLLRFFGMIEHEFCCRMA